MNELINSLIFSALMLAGVVLRQPVTNYLMTLIGSNKTYLLYSLADTAVTFVEQTMKDAPSGEKRDAALAALSGMVESRKLGFSQEALIHFIEASVYRLPHEIEKAFSQTDPAPASAQDEAPASAPVEETKPNA